MSQFQGQSQRFQERYRHQDDYDGYTKRMHLSSFQQLNDDHYQRSSQSNIPRPFLTSPSYFGSYSIPTIENRYSQSMVTLRDSYSPHRSGNLTSRFDYQNDRQMAHSHYVSTKIQSPIRFSQEDGFRQLQYGRSRNQDYHQRDHNIQRSWTPLFSQQKSTSNSLQNSAFTDIYQSGQKHGLQYNNGYITNSQIIVPNQNTHVNQQHQVSSNLYAIPQNINLQNELIQSRQQIQNQGNPNQIQQGEVFETIQSLNSSNQNVNQLGQYNKADQINEQQTNQNEKYSQILTQQKLVTFQGNEQDTEMRVGIENKKLVIGGVHIPNEKGLSGQLDGDALVYSIIDAISGACKYGEIVQIFSELESQHQGFASLNLLQIIREKMESDNIQIINIDSSIIVQKLNISKFIANMEQNISKVLNIPVDKVCIKASYIDDQIEQAQKEQVIACKTVCVIQKYIYPNEQFEIPTQTTQKQQQENINEMFNENNINIQKVYNENTINRVSNNSTNTINNNNNILSQDNTINQNKVNKNEYMHNINQEQIQKNEILSINKNSLNQIKQEQQQQQQSKNTLQKIKIHLQNKDSKVFKIYLISLFILLSSFFYILLVK